MFKDIDVASKKLIDEYLGLVDYEACEYSFTTLYMWKDLYNLKYYHDDKFIVIIGKNEDKYFFIQPLTDTLNIDYAMEFIFNYFESINQSINMRAITKEFKSYLEGRYIDKFKYIEDRDSFDYVYEGEILRSLAGRKNSKKRNHLNYFFKEYEGRFRYKALGEDSFDECRDLLNSWTSNKEIDEDIKVENTAIDRVFKNYKHLKSKIKIGGIYVDDKLQSFSIGEMLTDNMAVIHIEKANFNIRGLYQYINQQLLVNEFKDVEFINREDDLGIEGLREAKLSYHPVKFVEKYIVEEL
ncbi:DUF2156 domain-containing protein [Romboutsia weinsteinii]|nr:phosphatidylglycerol lysyltransferase domain-containing protein [Romboutsia weinsteinii]